MLRRLLQKKITKKILFSFTFFFFFLLFVDFIFFLILWIGGKEEGQLLVKKFPAQIRASQEDLEKAFPSLSPLSRTGQFLSFDFDPVLGFKRDEFIESYGDWSGDLKDKFLIVTFGGSTTVQDNWPKYIIEFAKEKNVQQDIIVFNAGHWGYMTFNEKILFSSYVLPELEAKFKKPDLVLTLDGVNDIWFRILSYLEFKNSSAKKWYNQFHAYHQHFENDMQKLKTVSGSTGQLLANFSASAYSGLTRLMPYTLKTLLSSSKKTVQSTSELPAPVDPPLQFEKEVEDKIIDGYRHTLLDFYGAASIRDINYISYLQPVILEDTFDHKTPDTFYFPNANHFGRNLYRVNRMLSRLGLNQVVVTDNLYKNSHDMYLELNKKYPEHFASLLYLFKEIDDAENLYQKDAVHYKLKAKKLLAEAIVNDLISKKVLNSKE